MPHLIVTKNGRKIRDFPITREVTVVGRETANADDNVDLELEDRRRRISRYHAAIVRDERGFYFIRDLGSANHTFVNSLATDGRRLEDHDVIGIGAYELAYESRGSDDLKQLDILIITDDTQPTGDLKKSTQLDRFPENLQNMLSEGSKQRLHDIIKSVRFLSHPNPFCDELLNRVAPSLKAHRGIIVTMGPKNTATPLATYGIDAEHGEQIRISGKVVQKSFMTDKAVLSRSRGNTILSCSFYNSARLRGLFYLECDPEADYKDDDIAFLEAVCGYLCLRSNESGTDKVESSVVPESTEHFSWGVDFIANSRRMSKVCRDIETYGSRPNINVLILGETGVGKEVIAREIHKRSQRKGKFVAVELSKLNEELVAGTLFGKVKGAYTGATDSPGEFEAAKGGTIFLDEIGEIAPNIQAKLLRAVDRKEIQRIGSSEKTKADVRILAATNVNMDRALAERKFRRDLWSRFGGKIDVPTLANRRADIPLLVYYFIDKEKSRLRAVSHGAMRQLMKYNWPGNVRELRELISFFSAAGKTIIFDYDLPEYIRERPADADFDKKPEPKIDKDGLISILKRVDWNQSKAGRELGRSRGQIHYLIKKYKIQIPRSSSDTD